MIIESLSSIRSLSALLTSRRIRAHASVLAICLWGVCFVDYSTPGIFDRQGNVKFQDFLQFPVSARLIAQGRARQLYDDQVLAQEIRRTVGRDTKIYLQYFYGPQVALPFVPIESMPFLAQAALWSSFSLALYFVCVRLVWKRCTRLKLHGKLVAICAVAYPPLFHFFVRGQLSAVVLLCFTAAFLAFSSERDFLAGAALGFLAFKPQFLLAIPLIFLLARAWSALAGLLASSMAQLGFASLYFGRAVMESYFRMLLHSAGHPGSTELVFSPMQMHSLHSFWEMLIPWTPAQWALYLLSSLLVISIAVIILPIARRHLLGLAIAGSVVAIPWWSARARPPGDPSATVPIEQLDDALLRR